MQASLLPVEIEHEFDSTFDGKDLKRMCRGDDGHTYALKRLADHHTMPLCEWVGYHLCRAAGVRTPDFAVLHPRDGQPPAFGSRIVTAPRQVNKDPTSYEVTSFFGNHLPAVARIYALDAFLANPDRHGRNMLAADSVSGTELLAFDFSRAWLRTGEPFGNTEQMRGSHTQQWWRQFKRMQATPDMAALDRVEQLGDDWLHRVLDATPPEWRAGVDCRAVLAFWARRRERTQFARLWL